MKTPQLPVPTLAAALGLTQELWLKREDLHHHGSHKGRAIPLMISEAVKAGKRSFVMSSSGNAVRSAIITVQNFNKNKPTEPLSLTIFVGEHIDPKKLDKIKQLITDTKITLTQSARPIQEAFTMEKEQAACLLRQSINETALLGYRDLAKEISKIPDLAAVFVPASSGTTAQGLFEGFSPGATAPEIHIVQTTTCHPLVDAWREATGLPPEVVPEEISLAGAIVDRVAHRRTTVVEAVVKSVGAGWIVTNAEIIAARELVKTTLNLSISPTSALGIAALTQAIKKHRTFKGAVVCVITGD